MQFLVFVFEKFSVELLDQSTLFSFRFRPGAVKNIIHEILNEELSGKQYDAEETAKWTRTISDSIKDKLKGITKIFKEK